MATRSLGTIKHRSFAYFLLLAAAAVVGMAGSLLLRSALQPLMAEMDQIGFWGDFVRGGVTTISLAPVLLALIAGRRLIRRFWTVVPNRSSRSSI